ncbi:MAG: isocitrate/isopropylmalate dehydrogenase family protein [Proteobacteria bacterium]|nr:isocitrate/isopropylmalate dehydrogenase family protein [Pseudomonadota bacterium]
MKFLVLPGDGIGPEIVASAVDALEALDRRYGLKIELERHEVGFASLERTGSTLPPEVMALATQVDGVLLGPVSTEDYPPLEKGGINPSSWFRKQLDLYANIRPSYVRPGVPCHAADMDLVIVRENTEGFYADRNMAVGSGEFMPTPEVALAIGKLTTEGCRRIAVTAFELARRRRRHVTAVHKANVLKIYSGLFLDQVRKVAIDYPDVELDTVIVDAMAALLIREPQRFDVVVTTNMFGDILSDEASEIAGGLGLAGSLNAGDKFAVAQAAHGSAPDIAGQDKANPVAFLQSVAMLLEHLGARKDRRDLTDAAETLKRETDALLASPATRTPDLGGRCGTKAFTAALVAAINAD